MSKSAMSPELLALLADLKPELPQPKPMPMLAASGEGKPNEAVVPLEGEDLERAKSALAGRYARINGDEVGFDKICHARVTCAGANQLQRMGRRAW